MYICFWYFRGNCFRLFINVWFVIFVIDDNWGVNILLINIKWLFVIFGKINGVIFKIFKFIGGVVWKFSFIIEDRLVKCYFLFFLVGIFNFCILVFVWWCSCCNEVVILVFRGNLGGKVEEIVL